MFLMGFLRLRAVFDIGKKGHMHHWRLLLLWVNLGRGSFIHRALIRATSDLISCINGVVTIFIGGRREDPKEKKKKNIRLV